MDGKCKIFVGDSNVDQALKILKKKMQREGVIREQGLRKAIRTKDSRESGSDPAGAEQEKKRNGKV